MALSTLSARVDTEDKAEFEEFCADTGMNVTTTINMFIKAVLRERRLPFEISTRRDEKGEAHKKLHFHRSPKKTESTSDTKEEK